MTRHVGHCVLVQCSPENVNFFHYSVLGNRDLRYFSPLKYLDKFIVRTQKRFIDPLKFSGVRCYSFYTNISYRYVVEFCLVITDVTVERTFFFFFFFPLIYFPGRRRRHNKTVIKRFHNRRYKYIHFFFSPVHDNSERTFDTNHCYCSRDKFFFPSVSATRIYAWTENTIEVFVFSVYIVRYYS